MTETKNKALPAYCRRMNKKTAQSVFKSICEVMAKERYYRQTGSTAKQLAERLGVDARHITAAAVLNGFSGYTELVNSYRLKEACKRLRTPKYADETAEEAGLMAGYASRQAFYMAFKRAYGMTPGDYRKRFTEKVAATEDELADEAAEGE